MYYRKITTPASEWKRIKTFDFFNKGLHQIQGIEYKFEFSSPKQVQQRKNFILKGQLLSTVAQLNSYLYVPLRRNAIGLAHWERLKLLETIQILKEAAARIK